MKPTGFHMVSIYLNEIPHKDSHALNLHLKKTRNIWVLKWNVSTVHIENLTKNW